MATEFARRLALKDEEQACEAVVDVPFTIEHVDELRTAITKWRAARQARRDLFSQKVDDGGLVNG